MRTKIHNTHFSEKDRKDILKGGPSNALFCADVIDRGPTDETRDVVLLDPHHTYLYTLGIDKKPRKNTRKGVLYMPLRSYDYAKNIDKKPKIITKKAVLFRKNFTSVYYLYNKNILRKNIKYILL